MMNLTISSPTGYVESPVNLKPIVLLVCYTVW